MNRLEIEQRPWRRNDETDELLAADVSQQWRKLLDESKSCVQQLRAATEQADRRLDMTARVIEALRSPAAADRQHALHERILDRLEQFDRRLTRLESQLRGSPGADPTPPLKMTADSRDAA